MGEPLAAQYFPGTSRGSVCQSYEVEPARGADPLDFLGLPKHPDLGASPVDPNPDLVILDPFREPPPTPQAMAHLLRGPVFRTTAQPSTPTSSKRRSNLCPA